MDQRAQRLLTDQLLPAVLSAGRLEMGYFRCDVAVQTKSDDSPVTIADLQAEACLIAALGLILPGITVVGEEAFAAGARPQLGTTFVLVDALDGTKQFVSGHPEFTINIAVVQGSTPVYGLIYAPALRDLLVTDGPGHALRASVSPASEAARLDALDPAPIRVRPVPVDGLLALQSRSRNVDLTDAYLRDFPVTGRQRLGSSYKFCLIACGEADIYPQLGDTREWDTAAAQAVLVAAGGAVINTKTLMPLLCNSTESLINPSFFAVGDVEFNWALLLSNAHY